MKTWLSAVLPIVWLAAALNCLEPLEFSGAGGSAELSWADSTTAAQAAGDGADGHSLVLLQRLRPAAKVRLLPVTPPELTAFSYVTPVGCSPPVSTEFHDSLAACWQFLWRAASAPRAPTRLA